MRISDWSSDVCSSDLCGDLVEIVEIVESISIQGKAVLFCEFEALGYDVQTGKQIIVQWKTIGLIHSDNHGNVRCQRGVKPQLPSQQARWRGHAANDYHRNADLAVDMDLRAAINFADIASGLTKAVQYLRKNLGKIGRAHV